MYKYAFYLMMYMLIVDILEMLTFLTLKITMYLKVHTTVAVLVCIPTNSVRGFPFLHTLSSIYCL